MTDSIVTDWLNENTQRGYPLREDVSRAFSSFTLDNILLDAQLIYNTAPAPEAQLISMQVTPTTVAFIITGKVFIASRAGSFPQYIRIADGSLLVIGDAINNLPANATYNFSGVYFEPGTIFEFDDNWRGVTELTFTDTRLPANTSVITSGDIVFVEGTQVGIRIPSDAIRLFAGTGFGEPIQCIDYTGNEVDKNCDEFIYQINGVSPSNNTISLVPGQKINIVEDPDNHRIFILLPFASGDVCGRLVRQSETSSII